MEFRKDNIFDELPKELDYLIEPAMKYGIHLFESQMVEFLEEEATEEDWETLAQIAERVKLSNHYKEVLAFTDEYPIDEYEQSAYLDSLFGVLDHAGFDFD